MIIDYVKDNGNVVLLLFNFIKYLYHKEHIHIKN